MKYIKLFENFNEDVYIEDAKWIVITHLGENKEVNIDPEWNAKNIIRLELDVKPTEDNIDACRAHLEEEGFFLRMRNWLERDECVVGVGRSVDKYCIKYLKDNFSNMEVVNSEYDEGAILYRYEPGDNIVYYEEGSATYIKQEIWQFFELFIGLNRDEINRIIKEWLREEYNINATNIESNVWNYFKIVR